MKRETLADGVYKTLRQQIVTGSLIPGDALYESNLSTELGVSRTPIREAFRRLEQEGLIEIEPRRGARVTQVSRDDVFSAFEIRKWLEPSIFAKAAAVMSDEQIAVLRKAVDEMPETPRSKEEVGAAIRADLQFHEFVADAVDNKYVSLLFSSLLVVTRRATNLTPSVGRFQRTREEHARIVDALEARDPEAAARAARVHMRNSYLAFLGLEEDSGRYPSR